MNPEEDKSGPEPVERSKSRAAGAGGVAGTQFWLWGRDMLFSLAVSFFIITFLYQPVRVEGTSMLPRLGDQDRLFINKFVYHFERSIAAMSWFFTIRAIRRRATSSA